MKKGGLLNKDWFYVILITLLFAAVALSRDSLLDKLEVFAYDAGVRMTYRSPGETKAIAIVAIDEQSLQRLGAWPLPRSIIATTISKISRGRPRAIGLHLPLHQAQHDPGLVHINKLNRYLQQAKFPATARRQVSTLKKLLYAASIDLDNDSKLQRTLKKSRNTYIPIIMTPGSIGKKKPPALAAAIRAQQLTRLSPKPKDTDKPFAVTAKAATQPLEEFARYVRGIGHITLLADADGGVRSEALMMDYQGELYPAMSLLLAARKLGMSQKSIRVEPGKGIKLGKLAIRTSSDMRMHNGFYRSEEGKPAFTTHSFYDIYSGRTSAKVLRNKIVLIGPTAIAAGAGTLVRSPVDDAMPVVERSANVIASILNEDFYTRPAWVIVAEVLIYMGILFYLIFMLPNFGAGFATFISFILFSALLFGGHTLMVSEKIWLHSVSPALLLLLGHGTISLRRIIRTSHVKRASETDSAHSTRMLGLSFQAQGQLDMAMDKFRKLPVDKSVLELIYNLALDYERKRQFGKAGAAYDYIMEYDKRFRDVKTRKQRVMRADGTLVIGNQGLSAGGTMILSDTDHKPTLGRYEVEREIGKGAMGTVYLGSDPKINRVVAIKTLALTEEFDEHEIAGIKDRFFREAETAGRLSHPNIVTIYDAGEEHDLAYIAMEFLQGKDLTHYIIGGELLPVDWVLDIVAHVADALDYAHKQEIVHRDIKPANIMYSEADDTVKVTDFGIARIVASSRTKTGVVLGTPSYMSPEQLAGKHVDGRSDLFSLGVTMYELLTGEQPFTGDSMAALMYQITNAKPKDISQVRKKLAPCIKTIIDKALQKDPAKRFQSGEEFKQAIDKCIEKL